MPKIFTSKTQQIGKLGEDLAVGFLMKQGFSVVERNYTKKWGEIDIIADSREVSHETGKKEVVRHFIEVKSVSCDLVATPEPWKTSKYYRPEENAHPKKLEKLKRTIQTYLMSFNGHESCPFERFVFDIYVVYIDKGHEISAIRRLENTIL